MRETVETAVKTTIETQSIGKMRWVRLVCACLIMAAIGFIYGWSVFSAPISNEFGWDPTTLSFTFTVLMWSFCLGGILGAKLTEKTSAKTTLFISAACIFAAFVLTTILVNVNTPWMLYITYGFIGGCSVGIAYTTTMGAIIVWFPDKTGMVSGAMLMCYGISTMILSSIASWLFIAIGWRAAFIALSACIAIVVVIASRALRKPNDEENSELTTFLISKAATKGNEKQLEEATHSEVNYTTREMLKQPSFYAYSVWMVLVCSIGLGITGTVNQLSLEAGATVTLAVAIVGMFSVFNGLGRLGGGFVFDKLNIVPTMAVVGALHALGCLLIIMAIITNSVALMIAAAVIGAAGIGSSSVVGSGFAATAFGSKHYAQNLSILNLMLIIAALIGPMIMSTSVSSTGTYAWGLTILGVVGVISVVLSAITGKCLKKMKSANNKSDSDKLE